MSQGCFPEVASVDGNIQAQEAWDDLHCLCPFPCGHWPAKTITLINTIGSALRNWANGTRNPSGGPSLYGANFQAITWAQQNAGYLKAAGTPNASLENALDTADARLGTFLNDHKAVGKLNTTLLLLGSKQGQGPVDLKTLKVSDPQTVIDGAGVLVAFFVGEDGGIVSSLL